MVRALSTARARKVKEAVYPFASEAAIMEAQFTDLPPPGMYRAEPHRNAVTASRDSVFSLKAPIAEYVRRGPVMADVPALLISSPEDLLAAQDQARQAVMLARKGVDTQDHAEPKASAPAIAASPPPQPVSAQMRAPLPQSTITALDTAPTAVRAKTPVWVWVIIALLVAILLFMTLRSIRPPHHHHAAATHKSYIPRGYAGVRQL
jgi:hypothetical protein